MTNRAPLSQQELVYQIRCHLRYELQFMLFAADAYQRATGASCVTYLDSATIHARNLLEWASEKDATQFNLGALGGCAARLESWERWANNRVAHMREREHDKAPWPGGPGTWDRPDKLMLMAKVVLDRLRNGLQGIPPGDARDAYVAVLDAALAYWTDPTHSNYEALNSLHDGSRDMRYPERS